MVQPGQHAAKSVLCAFQVSQCDGALVELFLLEALPSIFGGIAVLLYLDEVAAIRSRTDELNGVIAAVAGSHDAVTVDINGICEDIKANGDNIAGIRLSASFLTGGLFSADGFHPSNIAHAIIAEAIAKLDAGERLDQHERAAWLEHLAVVPRRADPVAHVVEDFDDPPGPLGADRDIVPALERADDVDRPLNGVLARPRADAVRLPDGQDRKPRRLRHEPRRLQMPRLPRS